MIELSPDSCLDLYLKGMRTRRTDRSAAKAKEMAQLRSGAGILRKFYEQALSIEILLQRFQEYWCAIQKIAGAPMHDSTYNAQSPKARTKPAKSGLVCCAAPYPPIRVAPGGSA